MSNVIIVTGMDNTGKTTLTEKLSVSLGRKVIKSPGPLSKEEQVTWMMENIGRAYMEDVIFERFPFIEEMVYGPILRGTSHFSLDDEKTFNFKKLNPIIIYTRPSRQAIMNFGTREQFPGVIEKSEKLLSEYDNLFFELRSHGLRVLEYNYETDDIDFISSMIIAADIVNKLSGGVL